MKTPTPRSLLSTVGSITLATLLASVALPACGGDEKQAKAPESEGNRAFRSGDDDSGDVGISAEVGGLNQSKTKAAFKRASKKFEKCLMDGLGRNEYMSGDVSFYVGIDDQGEIVDAYLEQSTLGDRATEKCMLDAVREQEWPPAVGGERGEARHGPIGISGGDVRPPVEWTIDEIGEGLAKIQSDVDQCKRQGNPNRYTATIYIDVDGSVIGAGLAQSQGGAGLAVDCLIGVLRSAQFDSPGSWPAKATFDL